MPATVLALPDLAFILQRGQDAIEIVLLDAHSLRKLGYFDAGLLLYQRESLASTGAASFARPVLPFTFALTGFAVVGAVFAVAVAAAFFEPRGRPRLWPDDAEAVAEPLPRAEASAPTPCSALAAAWRRSCSSTRGLSSFRRAAISWP